MNLNSITKFLIVFVVCVYTANAQTEEPQEKQIDYFTFKGGVLLPFEFGDNFAAEAMDFRYGLDLQANYYPFQTPFFLGFRFQYMRGEVTQKTLVGNYDYSNVTFGGLTFGYEHTFYEKWSIEPAISLGLTRFNNNQKNSSGVDFDDTAQSLFVSFAMNYTLSELLQIYIQPEYRRDFMNIDAPSINSGFFNNTNFFNLVLGVKFRL